MQAGSFVLEMYIVTTYPSNLQFSTIHIERAIFYENALATEPIIQHHRGHESLTVPPVVGFTVDSIPVHTGAMLARTVPGSTSVLSIMKLAIQSLE